MTPASLLEYIPKLSPEFRSPIQLKEWCEIIEEIARRLRDPNSDPMRVICTLPIRHTKTETTLHGVVWLLEQFPDLAIVVLCYSHTRAQWMGKRLRELAERTRVGPMRGWNTIDHWRNEHGGQVTVMSADQSREGYDCHVLLCDDPIDEHGAELQAKRDEVDRSITHYTARCLRVTKEGTRAGHVVIVASRFDLDDPSGRRIERGGWREVYFPAIIDLGLPTERALCESWMSLAEIRRWRKEQADVDPSERQFWSRMQGKPPPRGRSSFRDPTLYTAMPDYPGFRNAMGFDMSFTKAKRSDWAAIVVTRWWREKCYVRHFLRIRADLGDLSNELARLQAEYGRMPCFSIVSGPEHGAVMHLLMMGLPVNAIHASAPKFVRAQRTIDAHNIGNILWPEGPVTRGVMSRLRSWRGNEEDPDDEADALVSVYEGMALGPTKPTRSFGEWRY